MRSATKESAGQEVAGEPFRWRCLDGEHGEPKRSKGRPLNVVEGEDDKVTNESMNRIEYMELVQTLEGIKSDLQAVLHAQATMLKLMQKLTLHLADLPSKKVGEVKR